MVARRPHKSKVVGSNPTSARDTADKPPRGVSWVILIICKGSETMGYIYKITNDINDKVYIGKTQNSVSQRFSEHLRDAKKESCEKRPLYSAIRKYGEQHFAIHILEECSNEDLSERERYWIKKYGSYKIGYNATVGGDGSSFVDRNEILDELILNPCVKDIAKSVGCCADIIREVASQHGIRLQKHSDEDTSTALNAPKQIACIHCDDGMSLFDSVADAAKWLFQTGHIKSLKSGVRTHISECARGKRKTAYGYRWMYV